MAFKFSQTTSKAVLACISVRLRWIVEMSWVPFELNLHRLLKVNLRSLAADLQRQVASMDSFPNSVCSARNSSGQKRLRARLTAHCSAPTGNKITADSFPFEVKENPVRQTDACSSVTLASVSKVFAHFARNPGNQPFELLAALEPEVN